VAALKLLPAPNVGPRMRKLQTIFIWPANRSTVINTT
jgi:hypothetical protein